MIDDNAMQRAKWRRWSNRLAVWLLGFGLFLFAFVIAMDPYGILPSARKRPGPLMDLNQRYMYPQVVRSGRFDAAILGTSTVRLLDPVNLDRATGFRFANLAMNAATPWEQTQVAELFARETAQPKAVVWGIDPTWCEPDATSRAKRLTPRPFPPWLYDGLHWVDLFKLANFTSLEIAVRMAGYRLGVNKERLRHDGFEIFTPPDRTYDLARAQFHLYGAFGGKQPELTPSIPAATLDANELQSLAFPALEWLDRNLDRFPASTRRVLLMSPVHAAHQPQPGTRTALVAAECQARLQAIATRRTAAVIDFGGFNDITLTDANFWDPLHYRLSIASRLETTISDVLIGRDNPDPAAKIVPAPDL